MNKLFYIIFVFHFSLFADVVSDTQKNGKNSYLDVFFENANTAWNKTKEASNQTLNTTKEITNKGLNNTKSFFGKSKTYLIQETLITTLNLSLDYNNTIKVEHLKIEDNNTIRASIILQGEEQNLTLLVRSYDWGLSKDKKFIILENIDVDFSIPWLGYLFQDYLDFHNGYIKLSYSLSKETLLSSLKKSIETTYADDKDRLSDDYKDRFIRLEAIVKEGEENFLEKIFQEFLDPIYIKDVSIKKDNEEVIHIGFTTTHNNEEIFCSFGNFMWGTANKKTLIAIENIEAKGCNKPWLDAFMKKNKEQVLFKYTPLLENILLRIKP